MTKSIDQIEEGLFCSRNALARRRMVGDRREDPSDLLLWEHALDTADTLVRTVRSLSESGALQQQALQATQGRLQVVERGRESLEAENARLTRENGRLHGFFAEVSPREFVRYCQARAQEVAP